MRSTMIVSLRLPETPPVSPVFGSPAALLSLPTSR